MDNFKEAFLVMVNKLRELRERSDLLLSLQKEREKEKISFVSMFLFFVFFMEFSMRS